MSTLLETLPDSIRPWTWLAFVLTIAMVVAWTTHGVLYWIAHRLVQKTDGIADTSVVNHTHRPARVVLVMFAILLVLSSVSFNQEMLDLLRHMVGVGLIVSFTWLVIRALSVIDDVIMARHPINVRDNLQARRIHTQTRVLSSSAMVLVAVIGLSAALMTFPTIRQFGASLLASAGIAGLVLGMAARPAISNLIAGVQLALTQPIRLDDVLIVEGEWGRVEEITTTYVVICIWDQRRLIVPLQYFIEHPFQNWTRRTSDILGTVMIHADYTVPIEAVREELQRIAKSSDLWDGKVCGLQVTNATDRSVELRALVSATDAGRAWDLRCLVREKLIEFLQRQHPRCLPRVRAEMLGDLNQSSTVMT